MPDEPFVAIISEIQQNIGMLLEGQRNADRSRERIHSKIDSADEFIGELAKQTNELAARVKDIAVTQQIGNDLQGKLTNRINEMEPEVKASAQFRIDATPIVRLLKQVRLWMIAGASLLGVMATFATVAWANAGPIISALVKAWLSSAAS